MDCLSPEEINRLRNDSINYRSEYGAISPIGKNIFSLMEQKYGIVFLVQDFLSENFDAMITSRTKDSQRKYVVLNGKKPLINQIFAAAHEFYHFLFSFMNIERSAIICSFDQKEKEEVKESKLILLTKGYSIKTEEATL